MAKGKNVGLTVNDIGWAMAGAVGSVFSNRAVNEAIKTQSEQTKKMVGDAMPIVKIAGGGYVATRKKTPRNWKFFAMGVAGTGAVEAGIRFQPKFFRIGSPDGTNVYEMIGDTVRMPLDPAKDLQQTELFEEERVLSTADDYDTDVL